MGSYAGARSFQKVLIANQLRDINSWVFLSALYCPVNWKESKLFAARYSLTKNVFPIRRLPVMTINSGLSYFIRRSSCLIWLSRPRIDLDLATYLF
jgi:hypothetical protein